MEKARHPRDFNRSITIEEYRLEFGRPIIDPSGHRLKDDRERAICPVCKGNMNDTGGTTPGTFAKFSHFPTGSYCPLKIQHGKPYLPLPDIKPNPEIANVIRKAFRSHWKYHWKEITRLVSWLDVDEFLTLLADADRRNLWSYTRLREIDIPYVLVTRADFRPTKKKDGSLARTTWRRFYYSAEVRDFEDLWIKPPENVRLLYAKFKPKGSRGARPGLEELIEVEEVERIDFLNGPVPNLHSFVIKKVEDWFTQNHWPIPD